MLIDSETEGINYVMELQMSSDVWIFFGRIFLHNTVHIPVLGMFWAVLGWNFMTFSEVSVDMDVDMQEIMATLSNDTAAGPCKPEIQ